MLFIFNVKNKSAFKFCCHSYLRFVLFIEFYHGVTVINYRRTLIADVNAEIADGSSTIKVTAALCTQNFIFYNRKI